MNKTACFSRVIWPLVLIINVLIITFQTQAATYTVTSSSNWSTCSFFTSAPTDADIIQIGNGATLTVDVTGAICGELQIGQSSGAGTLTFAATGTPSLTVTNSGGQNGLITNSYATGGTIIMTSVATLSLYSIANGSGTASYTMNAGTVVTTGSFSQPSGFNSFNDLTISSGTFSLNYSSITASGTITVSSGATLDPTYYLFTVTGTLTGYGTIVIYRSGASDDLTHEYPGAVTTNLTLNYVGNYSYVYLDNPGMVCANMNISGNDGIYIFQSVTVTGTINVASGSSLVTEFDAIVGGNLTGSGSIYVSHTNGTDDLAVQFPGTLDLTGLTVYYAGGTRQNITAHSFSNLIINNNTGAGVLIAGDVSVSGDLTLGYAANFYGDGTHTLNVAGNATIAATASFQTYPWYYAGTNGSNFTIGGTLSGDGSFNMWANETAYIGGDMTIAAFQADGNSRVSPTTLILNGTSAQNINPSNSGTGSYAFYNLVNENSSGTVTYDGVSFTAKTTTINSNATLAMTSGNTLSGGITGNGKLVVTATGNANDLTTQYTGSLTLTGLTVIYAGAASQTIAATTFNNLTINNSSGVLLASGNSIVNNNLTLTNGILNTDASDLLVFTSTATAVSGASNNSYINGPVENNGLSGSNPSFTFPTGHSGRYAPAMLSGITGPSDFTVQYFTSNHSQGTSGITGIGYDPTPDSKEYWTVIENSGGVAANLTLYWEDAAYSGILATHVGSVTIYNDHGTSTWLDLSATPTGTGGTGGTGSATVASVPYGDFGGGGYFTFGDNSGANPLPVSLLSFNAQYENGISNLKWQTASETNNNYFNIERSLNGADWTIIGKVDGHNTSYVLNTYNFTDNLQGITPNGAIYYRLKQVDFNENFTYSNIADIEFANSGNSFSLYPNPAKGLINIIMNSANDAMITFKITDMTGREIICNTLSGSALQNIIDVSALNPGPYFFVANNCKEQITRIIMKE